MKTIFTLSFLFLSITLNAQNFKWVENKDFYDSVYYTCFFGSGYTYPSIKEGSWTIQATKGDEVKKNELIQFYKELINMAERPIEEKDFYTFHSSYADIKKYDKKNWIITGKGNAGFVYIRIDIENLKMELDKIQMK